MNEEAWLRLSLSSELEILRADTHIDNETLFTSWTVIPPLMERGARGDSVQLGEPRDDKFSRATLGGISQAARSAEYSSAEIAGRWINNRSCRPARSLFSDHLSSTPRLGGINETRGFAALLRLIESTYQNADMPVRAISARSVEPRLIARRCVESRLKTMFLDWPFRATNQQITKSRSESDIETRVLQRECR